MLVYVGLSIARRLGVIRPEALVAHHRLHAQTAHVHLGSRVDSSAVRAPNTTTWQQIIVTAKLGKSLSHAILPGNKTLVSTTFPVSPLSD